jgi:DNA-binding NarL/FixJ family response regulator
MLETNGIFSREGALKDQNNHVRKRVSASGMNQSGLIKVYMVEDSSMIRTALSQRIEDDRRFTIAGYADTAPRAMSELAQIKPDVVIIDLHLKQGTGYDILAYLRSTGPPAGLKVIVLTNYASAAHRRRALELGASNFFDKSMQFDEMLNELRVWADKKAPGDLGNNHNQ